MCFHCILDWHKFTSKGWPEQQIIHSNVSLSLWIPRLQISCFIISPNLKIQDTVRDHPLLSNLTLYYSPKVDPNGSIVFFRPLAILHPCPLGVGCQELRRLSGEAVRRGKYPQLEANPDADGGDPIHASTRHLAGLHVRLCYICFFNLWTCD